MPDIVAILKTCASCREPRAVDTDQLCARCANLNRSFDGALLALIDTTNDGTQSQEDK